MVYSDIEKLKKEKKFLQSVKELQPKMQGRVISATEKEAFLNNSPVHTELEKRTKKRRDARLVRYEKTSNYSRTRKIK